MVKTPYRNTTRPTRAAGNSIPVYQPSQAKYRPIFSPKYLLEQQNTWRTGFMEQSFRKDTGSCKTALKPVGVIQSLQLCVIMILNATFKSPIKHPYGFTWWGPVVDTCTKPPTRPNTRTAGVGGSLLRVFLRSFYCGTSPDLGKKHVSSIVWL